MRVLQGVAQHYLAKVIIGISTPDRAGGHSGGEHHHHRGTTARAIGLHVRRVDSLDEGSRPQGAGGRAIQCVFAVKRNKKTAKGRKERR